MGMLRNLGASMASKIKSNLWGDESQIYANKFPNGTFYPRISPTSFYALQTLAPSDEEAKLMVTNWLMNSTRFCIAPNGDFEGNTDTCYWGLPSISADDPAFPPLGYWRGYVWGPMALLTYWGLQMPQYAGVDIVQTARKALVAQMREPFLS